jgi:hypothetical protein
LRTCDKYLTCSTKHLANLWLLLNCHYPTSWSYYSCHLIYSTLENFNIVLHKVKYVFTKGKIKIFRRNLMKLGRHIPDHEIYGVSPL